jgi:hypothetical protein
MRLDPIAQKAGRYREPHQAFFYGFELHTSEPATEHILAKFSAQLILDPSPSLLIGACHIDAFFRSRRNLSEHVRTDGLGFANTLHNWLAGKWRGALM